MGLVFLAFGAFLAFRAMEIYRGLENREEIKAQTEGRVASFLDNLFKK